MEDEADNLIVRCGDRKVSTKELTRQAGTQADQPTVAVAQRHTGYMVGGTSPFGTTRTCRYSVEKSILDLPVIYMSTRWRGFLMGVHPDIVQMLQPGLVNVALE